MHFTSGDPDVFPLVPRREHRTLVQLFHIGLLYMQLKHCKLIEQNLLCQVIFMLLGAIC